MEPIVKNMQPQVFHIIVKIIKETIVIVIELKMEMIAKVYFKIQKNEKEDMYKYTYQIVIILLIKKIEYFLNFHRYKTIKNISHILKTKQTNDK